MGLIQVQGELFHDVQTQHVFHDCKTFVDCIPKKTPGKILDEYFALKRSNKLDIKQFTVDNFIVPEHVERKMEFGDYRPSYSMTEYINILWINLYKDPDTEINTESSLLPLPYSYVVPGGRFREIYYWDSFFTMLGLLKSSHIKLAVNMCKNFSHLIKNYGHIPNGNRQYYLGRSQPPFFSLMIDLITRNGQKTFYRRYLKEMIAEYEYWMKGEAAFTEPGAINHVVKIDSENILNRYYDDQGTPRPESYAEDLELAEQLPGVEHKKLYRDLRAGAESGWDYSSRWFRDYQNIGTICTTDLVPVDLNCILYSVEKVLSKYLYQAKKFNESLHFSTRAEKRKTAIQKYLWNDKEKYFCDYDYLHKKQRDASSLVGIYALYFGLATPEQAKHMVRRLQCDFLKKGGLVTTTRETGQQWDSPNGWAPLQWLAIKGLRNYGYFDLANEIKFRWVTMCRDIFNVSGKLFEKYDVVNCKYGDGGEYDPQDGFGWTNGVLLDLLSEKETIAQRQEFFYSKSTVEYH